MCRVIQETMSSHQVWALVPETPAVPVAIHWRHVSRIVVALAHIIGPVVRAPRNCWVIQSDIAVHAARLVVPWAEEAELPDHW